MSDFERDCAWTIAREGGAKVTNFPYDPGGLTKYGISKRAHPDIDIANLSLAGAETIYREQYWGPSGANSLPEPLALNVFDTAVNAGVGQAIKLLAVAPVPLDPQTDAYLWARVAFYTDLVVKHPEKAVSLAGWLKRVLLARAESASRR